MKDRQARQAFFVFLLYYVSLFFIGKNKKRKRFLLYYLVYNEKSFKSIATNIKAICLGLILKKNFPLNFDKTKDKRLSLEK